MRAEQVVPPLLLPIRPLVSPCAWAATTPREQHRRRWPGCHRPLQTATSWPVGARCASLTTTPHPTLPRCPHFPPATSPYAPWRAPPLPLPLPLSPQLPPPPGSAPVPSRGQALPNSETPAASPPSPLPPTPPTQRLGRHQCHGRGVPRSVPRSTGRSLARLPPGAG